MFLYRRIEKRRKIVFEGRNVLTFVADSALSFLPAAGKQKTVKSIKETWGNKNIYRKKILGKSFLRRLVAVICSCGDCDGDVTGDVKLGDFDGLFLFEGCRRLLVDFSDNVDDFSWENCRNFIGNFLMAKFRHFQLTKNICLIEIFIANVDERWKIGLRCPSLHNLIHFHLNHLRRCREQIELRQFLSLKYFQEFRQIFYSPDKSWLRTFSRRTRRHRRSYKLSVSAQWVSGNCSSVSSGRWCNRRDWARNCWQIRRWSLTVLPG